MAHVQGTRQAGWVARIYDREALQLDRWTKNCLASHEAFPTVHRHGEAPLPTMRAIIQILEDLFAIISPGYASGEQGSPGSAPHQIRSRIARVYKRLTAQVARDLRFSASRDTRDGRDFDAEARGLVCTFIDGLPEFVKHLDEDASTMFFNDPAAKSLELILICYPGVAATRIFRIAHELHRAGLTLIPRMMTEYAHSRTGIDIHAGATIGRRFAIDHGTGLVVGETTIIGDDVTVFQGVTIGARKFPRDEHGSVIHDSVKRHPTIGNRVTIYANATILGGDTIIGDDVVIGACTWIEESIEPEMIVTNEKPGQRRIKNRLLPRAVDMTDDQWFRLFQASIDRCDDY